MWSLSAARTSVGAIAGGWSAAATGGASMGGGSAKEGEICPTSRGVRHELGGTGRTRSVSRAGARSTQMPQSKRAMQIGSVRARSVPRAGDTGGIRPNGQTT